MRQMLPDHGETRHREQGRSRGRATIKAGKFEAGIDLDVTPTLFLGIGCLVSMILLSVPPIIRAAKERPHRQRD